MRMAAMGFDAFGPNHVERLLGSGEIPHLSKFENNGGYSRLASPLHLAAFIAQIIETKGLEERLERLGYL